MRAIAAALVLCACVDTGSQQAAVIGGAADDGDPAAVALAGAPTACGAAPGASCSGALIAPRVVLTAAHCVMRPDPSLVVVLGATTDAPAEVHQVLETHVDPAFDPSTHAHDVALLVLDRASATAPLAMSAAAMPAQIGDPVRVIGFGIDSLDGMPGVKRSGAAMVSTVSSASFRTTPAPAMTCSGDSGGPVMWTGASGEVIAGVTSSGDPACAQFADNIDVGAERAFIDPIVAAAAGAAEAHGDGPIGRDQICATACTTDADCPAGFACKSDLAGGARCVAPGLAAGDFGATCTDACAAGMCAALPDGAGCACFAACTDAKTTATGCGCRSGSPSGGELLLFSALVLRMLRNRRKFKLDVQSLDFEQTG